MIKDGVSSAENLKFLYVLKYIQEKLSKTLNCPQIML